MQLYFIEVMSILARIFMPQKLLTLEIGTVENTKYSQTSYKITSSVLKLMAFYWISFIQMKLQLMDLAKRCKAEALKTVISL